MFLLLPAYLRSIHFGFLTLIRPGQAKAELTIRPAMTCRTGDWRPRPNRDWYVHAGSHRMRKTFTPRKKLRQI